MNQQTKRAFTLVELIVVITILAILGTIAFISLQGYSKDARDSKRLSDIHNIKIALELFSLQTGKYPMSDNSETVTYGGDNLWHQGVVGDNVTSNLQKLNEKPLDPLLGTEYIYSVTDSRKEYEVLALYEGNQISSNMLISQTYAADNLYPVIDGTYNQVYVQTKNYIFPTPSIITSINMSGGGMEIDATSIDSQVVSNGDNIPSIGGNEAQTGALDINLSATGTITSNSTDEEKISVIEAIQNAYTGTTLSTQSTYAYILDQTTTEEILSLVNSTILDGVTVSNVSGGGQGGGSGPEPSGWMLIDPNCGIPDIVIGTQTWAGCNSTLGTGFEWGQNSDGSNGIINSCYNYDGTNNIVDCSLGDPLMVSNASAKGYFDIKQPDGANVAGDSEFDNIWGKLYTWDQAVSSACGSGYHLPSNADIDTLEEYFGCTTGVRTGRGCSGLGGLNHSTTNSGTSIVEHLKIPIAGKYTGNSDFRGTYASLRTSSSDGSIWNRYFMEFWLTDNRVTRKLNTKTYGFSVRCIKD